MCIRIAHVTINVKERSDVFTISIKWGDYLDEESPEETYSFATQAELDAFMLGVAEAEGWMGYTILPVETES